MKTNCRFFISDRPCAYQKRNIGLNCGESCTYFEPEKTQVLIVKFAALGDVLRTTSIIKYLWDKYDKPDITWVTYRNAVSLLQGIEHIKEILVFEDTYTLARLLVQKFDVMINLDLAMDSLSLAGLAKADTKIGFALNWKGEVECLNEKAGEWFELSHWDKLKKLNKKTYQQHMLNIISGGKTKYNPAEMRIIVKLSETEKKFAESFKKVKKIGSKTRLIGMNTAGGKAWPRKAWPVDNTAKLIKLLLNKTDDSVILFGGTAEKERNKQIMDAVSDERLIDSGTDNNLKQFCALLNLCDIIVTTDSLALHIVSGLGKKIVALFGPTSVSEIELYGLGKKIVAPVGCTCCYKRNCDKKLDCMSLIKPETVFKAVQTLK